MAQTEEQRIIRKYLDLIDRYTDDDVSATDFSREYLEEFKNEDTLLSDDTYWILQDLFAEADAYCEPEIREDVRGGIDDDELREAALETSTKLRQRLETIGS